MTPEFLACIGGFVVGYVGWPSVFVLTGPWTRRLTELWGEKARLQVAATHVFVAIFLMGGNFFILLTIGNWLSGESHARTLRLFIYLGSLGGLVLYLLLGKLGEMRFRRK